MKSTGEIHSLKPEQQKIRTQQIYTEFSVTRYDIRPQIEARLIPLTSPRGTGAGKY